MPDNDRYIIPLRLDPDGRFLWFELEAGEAHLAIVPQPHTPLSSITPGAREALIYADCLSSSDRDFTEDLTISGALLNGGPAPRIPVEISNDPDSLGVDGILGFDFFARFTEVNFILPPHRLVLIDP